MYGGPEHSVTLRCTADLEPAMRERFGTSPILIPEGETHFHFTVPICVSDQFYGWVCGFGGKVEITAPRCRPQRPAGDDEPHRTGTPTCLTKRDSQWLSLFVFIRFQYSCCKIQPRICSSQLCIAYSFVKSHNCNLQQ